MEIYKNDENNENDENRTGQVVEEYASAPEDFQRIHNKYYYLYRREDGNENVVNPDALPFCLNIVSSSIREIPDNAADKCRTLTAVRVLQRRRKEDRIILRTIGCGAFWSCKRLRRINEFLKLGGVIRLEYASFAYCCGIEGELVLPSSVVLVGKECFGHCASITSVVFEPSSTGTVVEIQNYAFIFCTEISSVTLPPSLEHIPQSCFAFCIALIAIPIPPSVQTVDLLAFEDCRSLPTIDLPESLDTIGREAFLNCTGLITVTIRSLSNDIQIDNGVFVGCTALTTINVRPWIWGKLLSSMKIQNSNATLPIGRRYNERVERRHNESKAQFLDKFLEGTFVPLHSIHLYSWYGPQLLESVQDRPNTIYRILRTFSNFFDDIPTK